MKTDQPSEPIIVSKGPGPSGKAALSMQVEMPVPNAPVAASVPLTPAPPPGLSDAGFKSKPILDMMGELIPEPTKDEAAMAALRALVNQLMLMFSHREFKAMQKLARDSNILSGDMPHIGEQMKQAKQVLGI